MGVACPNATASILISAFGIDLEKQKFVSILAEQMKTFETGTPF